MVSLVSGPASAARVSPRRAVGTVHRPVRRATGVRTGPAPVRDVHCRRCQHRRATTSVGAPVRRHTSLQPVSPKRLDVALPRPWRAGGWIKHVASWMDTNRLQLNAAKTEFIWFVPPHQRQQFQSDRLAVGSVQVTPAASVRDLGVYLDSNMSVRSHVTRLVCTCFSIL